MSARPDPYRQFNFRLEVDGLQLANFCEVSLGAAFTEVVEYREGGDKSAARKLPGLTKFSNVTLKRGITSSLELYEWHRLVAEGRTTDARRNVAVILSDETGTDVARFSLRNAWPVKYEAPSFNANGNEVAMEIIEIAHEGLTRES
jgi:phage tail-like protein